MDLYPHSLVFTLCFTSVTMGHMALIRQCERCDKEFRTKPSHVKNGHGKYCSRLCGYLAHQKRTVVTCHLCGKQTYRTPKGLRTSKSGKYFCGKSCQTQWRNQLFVGPKHANWKHGRQVYRSVLSRVGREKVCEICRTKDERILAVHHKDRNRLNNAAENLAWLCHNCHFLVHHYDVGRDRDLLVERS